MYFMCISCAGKKKIAEYHSEYDENKKQSPEIEAIRPSGN